MSASARAGANPIPFLRTSNVLWDDIDLSTVDQMSMTPEELEAKSLLPGDVLVCEGGDIGRSAVWTGGLEAVSFQNHLHRLRPLNPQIAPRFFVYFLQSAFTQLGMFEGAGNDTTIPNLSRNRLSALEVPVPPIEEQSDIARVLGQVRHALKLESAIVAHTRQLKQVAMRELFSHGLRGESQKDSEIGPIPRSWACTPFAGVREWLQYGTSVRCTATGGKHPVLRIPNLTGGQINPTDLKYCDLSDEEADGYLLEKGDLLFIRTNGVIERLGSCAVYDGRPGDALFASYLIRARVKSSLVPRFAAFFFSSERGSSLVAGRATPAADGKYNLNTGIIDSLPIPLPPTQEEQQEIVEILETIDQKIDLHEKKRVVLEDLFESLLHKLMTGEIRVSDLDLSALEQAAGPAEAGHYEQVRG
jgi:type I restriction enzyme S subunit